MSVLASCENYKCNCGQEFHSKQALAGHVFWCRSSEERISERNRKFSESMVKKIDFTPSSELSYVIGVVLGDGSACKCRLKRGGFVYRVKLAVNDFDFAMEFNKAISKVLRKKTLYSICKVKYTHGHQYQVTGTSKNLMLFLKQDLQNFKKIINAYPADFIRGFFDSDGYVDDKSRGGTQTIVGFTNTKRPLIDLIKNLLKKHFTIYSQPRVIRQYNDKEEYDLRIWRKNDVKKFAKEIGSSLQRKTLRLQAVH